MDTDRGTGSLVLVIIGIAILTLVYSCAGNDKPARAAGTPAATSAQRPLPTEPSVTATASSLSGALVADGWIVIPRAAAESRIPADGDLSAYTGRGVTARSIPVASVPADEGFWVGNSTRDRVWVELTGAPSESPYDVDKGDHVSFTGRMVPNADGFAKKLGVTDAEGGKQLDAQGQHVAVDKGAVQLSK